MIRKIALKNFMSHLDTVLELGPGLNVITGPNNCGKSAIVAAIQLVCRNHLTGDVVMRHGAKDCSVTLWTDDEHEITWRRKGKDVSYTIDGVEHSRLKGKVPEQLHAILRLPEIEEGNEAFDLHFGLQKEPIFLLDDTGSKAAKFFASSSDAARLIQMQSLHKSRNADRKAKLKLLEKQSTELKEQIEQLSPILELRLASDELVSNFQLLGARNAEAVAMQNAIQQLTDCNTQWLEGQERCRVLKALPDWPDFLPTDDLENWLSEYQAADMLAEYLAQRRAVLERLPQPPLQQDTLPLQQTAQKLESALKSHSQVSQRTGLLTRLQPPPELKDFKSLQEAIQKLREQTNQMGRHSQHMKDFENQQKEIQEDIERWLKKHPECPVCHRTWSYEQAISREAHQHA